MDFDIDTYGQHLTHEGKLPEAQEYLIPMAEHEYTFLKMNHILPTQDKKSLSNLSVLAGQSSKALTFSPSRIFFHSFRETTLVSRAVYQILDGLAGQLIMSVSLAPGESTRDYLGSDGLSVSNYIYFNLVSGSVEGNLAMITETEYQGRFDKVEVVNQLGAEIGSPTL